MKTERIHTVILNDNATYSFIDDNQSIYYHVSGSVELIQSKLKVG